MIEINGKQFPLWSQFIERKSEWMGGTLQDMGDDMDVLLGLGSMTTKITDIDLRANGDDSAYFSVDGENFGCGFDVQYGGIIAGAAGWITFSGYGGHTWRIKMKNEK
jgi:hypothetical protein